MAARKAKATKPETAPEYQPNEREKRIVQRVSDRARERGAFDRLKVLHGDISSGHKDHITGASLQMDALGLSSYDGYVWFLSSFANAVTKGKEVNEVDINGALGFVKAMQPRDDMEALLLAQMAATHNLTMTFARRLNHVDNIQQQDSASNAYNKLARTFAAQMQTLKQYRSTGQQVVVKRVDVREGGQAIVGTVNNSSPGGGGNAKNESQSHAPMPLTDERGSQMLCEVQKERDAVPRTGGQGQGGLPDARRVRGRS